MPEENDSAEHMSGSDWSCFLRNPAVQYRIRLLLQSGDAFVRSQCPNRYSFLVVRNGYLVWMYWDRNADVMSVSKSVLSLLLGQAMDRGDIESLDRKMADYFPEYFSSSTDARKRQITLRHLLTMTAGFQWTKTTTGNTWVVSRDWYKFIIDLPMAANPGDVFDYNSGLSHLLAGVVSRASGQSAMAFGNQNLFRPLGISNCL
jgi:Beta-lactamase